MTEDLTETDVEALVRIRDRALAVAISCKDEQERMDRIEIAQACQFELLKRQALNGP